METCTKAIPTIFVEEDQFHRRQAKKHLKTTRRARPDCFTVVPEYLKKMQHQQLETSSDSEEELDAFNPLKTTRRFIKRQDVRRVRPDCFTMVPEYLKKKQYQLESSSSSSSSSSSDSEDEFITDKRNTIPKYMKWAAQHQQQEGEEMNQESRKWFTLVDLEGLRPQQVTAKVNAKCRILLIKAKKCNTTTSHLNQQRPMEMLRGEEMTGGKVIRVIPLPDNIRLEKLRVQFIHREGRLLVKAPFTFRGEEGVQQQGRFLPTWIPIRVTLKQEVKHFYTRRYQQQQERNFTVRGGFPFSNMEEDIVPVGGKSWKKMHQNQQQISIKSLLKVAEIIRDETTGKPIMLVKVNTLGFRPEEIRVRVDDTKRVLIVEAIKRNIRQRQMHMEQEQEQGLPMKYLRREFVLPQWLDVNRLTFRVLKCGLLIVKLPIVKQNKMLHNINCTTRCGCDQAEIFGDCFNTHKQNKKDFQRRYFA